MTPQERKIIANYLWSIRSHKRILRLDSAPYDMTSEINSIKKMPDLFVNKTKAIIVLLMALLVMCVLAGCAQAQEFSNVQIVDAIYLAEGGSHAQFSYGIRSVHYGSIQEARRICLRTIKHYRRKYAVSPERRNKSFVEYVQSHYCPTKGALSSSEKKLNNYWLKNVMYFLRRES